jgi:hypothetical protein
MSIELEMEVEAAHHEAVKEEVEKREKTKVEKRRKVEDDQMLKSMGLTPEDMQ